MPSRGPLECWLWRQALRALPSDSNPGHIKPLPGGPATKCCPTPIKWQSPSIWCDKPAAVLTRCAGRYNSETPGHRGQKEIVSVGSSALIMARKRLNDLGEKYIPRLLRSSDPYKEARDT